MENVDLDKYLEDFSEEEIEAVKDLLNKGTEKRIRKIEESIYRVKPPSPQEFLDEWLGDEVRASLYSHVIEMFCEMWDYNKNLHETVLYGATRCHGKDVPILMYDGTIKKVQDVKVGDKVMGDDSTSRQVLETVTGKDNLYKINQSQGINYTVNSIHNLVLAKYPKDGFYKHEVIEIPVKDYYNLEEEDKTRYLGIKNIIKIVGNKYQIDREEHYAIKVSPIGNDTYYGFLVSNNHRYLLGDYTVCRNTGKSILARLSIVYCIIFLWCLESPHKYYGLSKISSLAIYLMCFSKIKARQLLLKPIENILKASPKFYQVLFEDRIDRVQEKIGNGKVVWCTASKIGEISFFNNIHICLGASPLDIIGADIVMALISEINFFIKVAGVSEESVWKTYTDTKDRIEGTVAKRYGSMIILDSSANNRESIIEEYILNQASKDPKVYFRTFTRWEAVPDRFPEWQKTGEMFTVFKGDSSRPPCIVDTTFNPLPGDERNMIKVPIDAMDFMKKNIYDSLKNLCVSGDTLIPLLSGNKKKIKDLVGKKIEVYSCTDEGEIVVGKATNIHSNGIKQNILRIWFDNNKYLDCTDNHKIMLRDGTYIEARKLKVNDSLMPFYTKVPTDGKETSLKGYEFILNNRTGNWIPTHRIVMKKELNEIYRKKGRKKWVVHHKDYNKRNNEFYNLELVKFEKHIGLHKEISSKTMIKLWKRKEFREKVISTIRKRMRDPIVRAKLSKMMSGKRNPAYRHDINSKKALNMFKKGMSLTNVAKTFNTDRHVLTRRLRKENLIKFDEIKKTHLERITSKIQLTDFIKLLKNDKVLKDCYSILGVGNKVLYRLLKQNGTTIKEFSAKYKTSCIVKHRFYKDLIKEELTKKKFIEIAKKQGNNKNIALFLNLNEESIRPLFKYFKVDQKEFYRKNGRKYNHKVIKIEKIKPCEVFDMTVDKYHNFAIDSGIFAHNCGVPVGDANIFFPDLALVESMFDPYLDNVQKPIVAPVTEQSEDLIMSKIIHVFMKQDISGKWKLKRARTAPRWVRVDLSESDDYTGMAMCHPEIRDDGTILCVYDFAFDISPGKDGINLDAILQFVRSLYRKYHIFVAGVSTDKYQSSFIAQAVKKDDKVYKLISVDESKTPYLVYKSKVLNGSVRVGYYLNIMNNIKSLIETSKKIEHKQHRKSNDENKRVGLEAKDVTDAKAGVLYDMFSEIGKHQITYNYDDINRSIDIIRQYRESELANMSNMDKAHLYNNLMKKVMKRDINIPVDII